MKVQHIVITLFSFRGKEAFKRLYWPGQNFNVNPLQPKLLDFRIMLFEMACLPGILSQTNQDFTWIIIIDKKLPSLYKNKLKELIAKKDQAVIYEYDPLKRIESIEWIKPFIKTKPDYLITSNIDDDDILPPDFIEASRRHVSEIKKTAKLPTLKLIGNNQIVQWDLNHSKEAPLGWRSPWHRGKFPASCGFSLLGKYPEVDFNVLGIVHRTAEKYIDFSLTPTNKNIAFHQNRFKEAFLKNNDNFKQWNKNDLLFDLNTISGPVLMTNHKYNAQYKRLHEKKPGSKIVIGPETFPEFSIDWDCAMRNTSQFNIDKLQYIKRKWHFKWVKFKRRMSKYLQ